MGTAAAEVMRGASPPVTVFPRDWMPPVSARAAGNGRPAELQLERPRCRGSHCASEMQQERRAAELLREPSPRRASAGASALQRKPPRAPPRCSVCTGPLRFNGSRRVSELQQEHNKLHNIRLRTHLCFNEGESGDSWGAAVARDHTGMVLMSTGRRLDRCRSVEEAESAAILMGLSEVAKLYSGQMILETNCAFVGGELQSGNHSKPACHAIMADARRLLAGFASSQISKVSRSRNKLAHELGEEFW